MAYHLHRHGITPAHLHQAEMTREMARQLSRGSMSLNNKDISQIAGALGLDAHELTRPLNDDERAEWHFYRVSARQVTEVWRRVAEASTAHNYSQYRLGVLLEIPQSVISRAMSGERKSPVLNWQQAQKIAMAFNLEDGPDAFIPPGFTGKNDMERE